PARRLHVGGAPGLRAERAQERRRVRRARTDFRVVRLQEGAALPAPIVLQRKDDFLKREHRTRVSAFKGPDFTGFRTVPQTDRPRRGRPKPSYFSNST